MSFDWIYPCSELVTNFQDTTCMQDVLDDMDLDTTPLCGLDCRNLELFYHTLAFWGVHSNQIPTEFLDLWFEHGGFPLEKGDAYAALLKYDYLLDNPDVVGGPYLYGIVELLGPGWRYGEWQTTFANMTSVDLVRLNIKLAAIHACKHDDLFLLRYIFKYPSILLEISGYSAGDVGTYKMMCVDSLGIWCAKHGSLECLAWLCEHPTRSQLPMDTDGPVEHNNLVFQRILIKTASTVPCLKYLKQNSPFWDRFSYLAFNASVRASNYTILEWMHSFGYKHAKPQLNEWYGDPPYIECIDVAAEENNIPMMEWLVDQGHVPTESSCMAACAEWKAEAVQWLIDHNCPWNIDECAYEYLGKLYSESECLMRKPRSEYENGEIPFEDTWAHYYMTKEGAGDVLRILHNHGCSWREAITRHGFQPDDTFIVWLATNGYPWFQPYCGSA